MQGNQQDAAGAERPWTPGPWIVEHEDHIEIGHGPVRLTPSQDASSKRWTAASASGLCPPTRPLTPEPNRSFWCRIGWHRWVAHFTGATALNHHCCGRCGKGCVR